MTEVNPQIHKSWSGVLLPYFQSESFLKLKNFLVNERKTASIYPPGKLIFNAFNLTPFDHVKVVILGQDPYHGKNQAHGLSFSVQQGIKPPPSLQNIYKEISTDIGLEIPAHGNLERWAKNGVLLLNATLTVRPGEPGSHQGRGWEEFTDGVIKELSANRQNLVFLLWGKFAAGKAPLIDKDRHLVLTAPHPSPFSAHKGFFGCRHFSKANAYLASKGIGEIDWKLE